MSFVKRYLWIFLVLLLIAGGAIAVFMTREDRGFISTETCHAIAWDPSDLPLLLVLDPKLKEWEPSLTEALDLWDTINPELFVYLGVYDPAEIGANLQGTMIAVAIDPAEHDDNPEHGSTTLTPSSDCEVLKAFILVPEEAPEESRIKILEHELGHALGLADDSIEWSIMYPRARFLERTVTERDADLILTMYQK